MQMINISSLYFIPALPKYLHIEGPDVVARDQELQYSCTVEGGDFLKLFTDY